MKYFITLFTLALCLQVSYSQDSFTIDDAIQYAIKNSYDIKLDQLDIRTADQEVKEYIATGLPKVNGSVEYQHFLEIPTSFVPAEFFGGMPGEFAELKFGLPNQMTAGVNMNTLIFDGSFFTGIRAQKLYKELKRKAVNQTEYEIKKNVTEAYVNVLLTKENIEMLDKNLENLDKSISETNAFYENGFVEKLDVNRLELSYDNLLSQKKTLQRIALLSENLLKFQMNYPLNEEIILIQSLDDVVDKVLVKDIEPIDKVDYNKRPEYSNILIGQQLNEINFKATRMTRYPSLVGFGNYQYQIQRTNLFESDEPGFFPVSIVGLSMNVPIYGGGATGIKEQKIKLDIEKTEIQKQQFERSVDLQVMNAYQQYLNAKEAMYAAKRQQVLADEIYEITQIKYKEGVGSSLETSQSEREVYAAQQQYMQSLFDLVSSKISLDIATGDIINNPF